MNQQIKLLWIEALRSGKYQQGKGHLRDGGDNYCCLGVLCDIHSKQTGMQWTNAADSSAYVYDGNSGLPGPIVRDWAGLDPVSTRLEDNEGRQHTIMHFNDFEGLSFLELADLIEAQL